MAARFPIWYVDQAQAFALGLRGRRNMPVARPRMPTFSERNYDSQHYIPYDYANPNPGPLSHQAFNSSYGIYDAYTLFSSQYIQNGAQLPAGQGVRLDDYGCYLAARDTDVRALHRSFGSEFDRWQDIRGRRLPLGLAAKKWCDVGDVDMDGNTVKSGEQGWYYLWWRGIHLLCGEEGLEAGMYRVRGTWFDRGLPGMYFGVYQGLLCVVNDYLSTGELIVDRWILLEEILQSCDSRAVLVLRTSWVLRFL